MSAVTTPAAAPAPVQQRVRTTIAGVSAPAEAGSHPSPVRLDVVIPTVNRWPLLERTLESLARDPVPAGMEVRICVVDNGSRDGSRERLEAYAAASGGRVRALREARRGRSHALNTGIVATSGELVALLDDDEEVCEGWAAALFDGFADPEVGFLGGPCHPRWGAEPPHWLPPGYSGVIGWVDGGDRVQEYGRDYPGMLMGGNAAFRRTVLAAVGLFSTSVGRDGGGRLLSCEDEEMYRRLLEAGARGLYLPEMGILHWVPPERLTRRYYRRWSFWHGVSQGILQRERPAADAQLAGVPRWRIGAALRAAGRLALPLREPRHRLADELAVRGLCGFLYGRHLYARWK